jgi:chaperone required for assembly of F1-ATPase
MKEKEKKPKLYGIKLDKTGHVVLCNDQPLLTPGGKPYALPTVGLAEAIAAEWRERGDKIDASKMPMTRLAATTLDLVSEKREKIIRDCIAYTATELLCHRAEGDTPLAKKQQEIWQPYLDWAALTFDALLRAETGIMPIEQPAEAILALERHIEAYDDYKLMGLHSATDDAGSLILGLALATGYRTAEAVFQAAELDTLAQVASWGEDPVTAARLDAVKRDLENDARWFALLI